MTNPIRDPRRAEVIRALRADTNGHGLPAGAVPMVGPRGMPEPYQGPWDWLATGVMLVDMMLVGKPALVMTPSGPQRSVMQDWTRVRDTVVAGMPAGEWTAEQAHQVNILNAMSEHQRRCMAIAEAAAGLRKAPVDGALPEAPSESDAREPEGLAPPGAETGPHGAGFDANGSPA